MSGILVSVVIPTLNRADMVCEAIESVLAQTLESLEIIVVDDGSTDDTDARVRRYGDRVRFLKTHHGGVAHARNVGMRHATGRYVTFLDSDDRLYPYALEIEARLLDRYADAALVCAEMSGFDANGLIGRYYLQTYHRSAYRNPAISYERIFGSSLRLGDVIAVPASLIGDDHRAAERRVYFGNVFDTYLLNLVLCQNTVMMRRSIVDEVGDRNEAVRHWQEVDYLLRITRRHAICFVDVPTYQMRFHSGQISTTDQANGTYVWMRKQQILLRIVKRHALADRAYYARHRQAIDRQLAQLHRAVAVPMLLLDGSRSAKRRAALYARRYLTRCARYGHPARVLQLATLAPPPIRAIVVKLIESARQSFRSMMWSLSRQMPRSMAPMPRPQ